MTNSARGEVPFNVGEERLILRPSFSAISEIETELGIGLVEIAERFAARRYGVKELCAVIRVGARAGGRDLDLERIGDLVMSAGLVAATGPVVLFLSNALTGGNDSKNVVAPPASLAS